MATNSPNRIRRNLPGMLSSAYWISACLILLIAVALAGWRLGRRTGLADNESVAGKLEIISCQVNGSSMLPTFHDGQRVRVHAGVKSYQLGDVVAVDWQNKLRIKRIAGLPGDVIHVANGRLFNGGLSLSKRFRAQDGLLFPPLAVGGRDAGTPIQYRDDSRVLRRRYPLTVGDQQLFLVGDHVSVSIDSRHLGLAPIGSVIGVVVGDTR